MTATATTSALGISSPFRDLCGIVIVEAAAGRCMATMGFTSGVGNELSTIHGGAVATLADASIAAAIRAHENAGLSHATIELSVRYLAPARSDLVARSRAIKVGRKIAVGEVEIRDADGELVAIGHGSWAMKRA